MSNRALPRPSAGARFCLERDRDDGATAVYRVEIATPDHTFAGSAKLGEDGTVDLAATGAPTELDAAAVTFARLFARGAAQRRAQGLSAWPERVTRWRGPGR